MDGEPSMPNYESFLGSSRRMRTIPVPCDLKHKDSIFAHLFPSNRVQESDEEEIQIVSIPNKGVGFQPVGKSELILTEKIRESIPRDSSRLDISPSFFRPTQQSNIKEELLPPNEIGKSFQKEASMMSDVSDEQKSNSEVKRSQFHNFQKHLVTTIRAASQKNKINLSNGPVVAKKMWSQFLKSKKYNKALLHILFGQFQWQNDEEQDVFAKFDFLQFTEKHKEKEIQEAQMYLRETVMEQMSRIKWEDFLSKRRMKRKEQFIQYIVEFIKQMEEGPLGKRISKGKIANLENKFNNSSDSPKRNDPESLQNSNA